MRWPSRSGETRPVTPVLTCPRGIGWLNRWTGPCPAPTARTRVLFQTGLFSSRGDRRKWGKRPVCGVAGHRAANAAAQAPPRFRARSDGPPGPTALPRREAPAAHGDRRFPDPRTVFRGETTDRGVPPAPAGPDRFARRIPRARPVCGPGAHHATFLSVGAVSTDGAGPIQSEAPAEQRPTGLEPTRVSVRQRQKHSAYRELPRRKGQLCRVVPPAPARLVRKAGRKCRTATRDHQRSAQG